MPKYGYLIVEGPHDVELVYRTLSPFGLRRVRLVGDLDPFFVDLTRLEFPPSGDLQKRVPIPLFLQSHTHSVAVHVAVGDTRLINTLEEDSIKLDLSRLTGIGIILDADAALSPIDRYVAIRDDLRAKNFAFPDDPGIISATAPRLGAYLLPDNQSQGTLEDILLECGRQVYPGLYSTATAHVDAAFQDASLVKDDLDELRKPAGRNKAIVGSMASILKPGRAVQVSLQDNRWLREAALAIPRVKAIQEFLVSLLEMTGPSSP